MSFRVVFGTLFGFLVLVQQLVDECECFLLSRRRDLRLDVCDPALSLRRQSELYLAKKIPTFDLDAIEAFEAQLEEGNRDEDADDAALLDDCSLEEGYEVQRFSLSESSLGKRLDSVISSFYPDKSRSFCGNLITDNRVYIVRDGGDKELLNRKSEKITDAADQIIEVLFPVEPTGTTSIIAQNLPLDIIYEDEHMIVLNKAAGMVVHPAPGNRDGTIVNALAHYLSIDSPFGPGDFIQEDGTINDSLISPDIDEKVVLTRPGIVHRLDKGTTGVLVVAKTIDALAKLSKSFADRRVKKTYLAITVGNPGKQVKIDAPIGRHPIHRQRMRVVPDPTKKNSTGRKPLPESTSKGRKALSFVDTLSFDGKLSLVRVRIETGRT